MVAFRLTASLALVLMALGCEGPPGSSSLPDASEPEAPPDAGADAGSEEPFVCEPARNPTKLSETCLYRDLANRTLAPDLLEYTPAHELWTDGADKRRWIRLPPGATIDSSDFDHWRFPVGTQLFKEFSKGGVLLETRLVQVNGPNASDIVMLPFVWRQDASDAVATTSKQSNVNGTAHDVPSARNCRDCHEGEPGRVLGFSALQLSGVPGLSTTTLADSGRLSHRPAGPVDLPAPGDADARAALGYLHANCGHCHWSGGMAWEHVRMTLRLATGERTPEATALFTSTVGVETSHWLSGRRYRIASRDTAESELYYRMSVRTLISMPPIGTEAVDDVGLAAVKRWIDSL